MNKLALSLSCVLLLSTLYGCDDSSGDEATSDSTQQRLAPTIEELEALETDDSPLATPPPQEEPREDDLLTLPYQLAELEDVGSFLMGLIVTNTDEFLDRSTDELTFFVPHEDAMSKELREGELKGLYRNENHVKARRLIYHHSIQGKWHLEDLKAGEYPTGSRQRVQIERRDDEVYFDGHRVISGDHVASNGIIHIIDGVSIPADD